jgi:hypothetical protein
MPATAYHKKATCVPIWTFCAEIRVAQKVPRKPDFMCKADLGGVAALHIKPLLHIFSAVCTKNSAVPTLGSVF